MHRGPALIGQGLWNQMTECSAEIAIHIPIWDTLQELPLTLDGPSFVARCQYCAKPLVGFRLPPPTCERERIIQKLTFDMMWFSQPGDDCVVQEMP